MRWVGLVILLATLPLAAQPAERVYLPADAIALAHRDLSTLPQDVRRYTRYLWIGNIPEEQRMGFIFTLQGHVNSLSQQTSLATFRVIKGTNLSLLSLDLRHYGWSIELWGYLATQEPYFHVTISTATYSRPNVPYSRTQPAKATPQKVRVLAPWLADTEQQKAILKEVVDWTTSKVPVVRGDWFFNQTAIQADRTPGYYDFLAIKDEKTFQDLIGFDPKRKRRKIEIREAVADSGVTLQPRAIVRFDADEGGVYWYTLDFRKALDKENPLRVLSRDIEEVFRDPKTKDAATEQYGMLPNGFWATGLFNNKGVRQDSAPDFIASDHRSKSNDHRVHVNASCMRCHDNGGLQDIDGWVRNLYKEPGPLRLQSPKYEVEELLRGQYGRDLQPFLDTDRAKFAKVVLETTGMGAKEYARAYGKAFEEYEDRKVTLEIAAQDLGVTPDTLYNSLGAYVQKTGKIDTVLAVFLLKGDRRRSIPIRQWEEVIPLAHEAIRGLVNQ